MMTLTRGQKIALARQRPDAEWVALFNELHGGRYRYGAIDRAARVVDAECPDHGPFSIKLGHHQQGKGCAACAGNRPFTTARFVAEAQAKHGSRFDYSATVWKGQTEVDIVCREHGPFTTKPATHLRGKGGCPACKNQGRRANKAVPHDEVLRRFRAVHADRYEYDFSTHRLQTATMLMVCPDHGEFWQRPDFHQAGSACPRCAAQRRGTPLLSEAEFLERAQQTHGDKYVYDFSTYLGRTQRIRITCPDHGEFWQSAGNHLNGAGCVRCSANRTSKAELEILAFLQGLFPDAEGDLLLPGTSVRVDVWVPSKKFALEYDGLYWHSEQQGKARDYHLDKTREAAATGVQLVHVFEDEWLEKKEACKLRLLHLLGLSFSSVGARKLEVRGVRWADARDFYDAFHLQGAGKPASLTLGLFEQDTPLAMMSFGKVRFGPAKEGAYEMLRYAAACQIQGGFSRLLAAARKQLADAVSFVSYADLRWSMGTVYERAGFVRAGDTPPGYFWCRASKRFARQDFQKHKLASVLTKFDPEKTEVQNCIENGYFRIFDCGHAKYVLELQAAR